MLTGPSAVFEFSQVSTIFESFYPRAPVLYLHWIRDNVKVIFIWKFGVQTAHSTEIWKDLPVNSVCTAGQPPPPLLCSTGMTWQQKASRYDTAVCDWLVCNRQNWAILQDRHYKGDSWPILKGSCLTCVRDRTFTIRKLKKVKLNPNPNSNTDNQLFRFL